MTEMLVKYWTLQEQIRSNVQREQETRRSNLANESLKGQSIAVEASKARELARHNQASEAIQSSYNRIQGDLGATNAALKGLSSVIPLFIRDNHNDESSNGGNSGYQGKYVRSNNSRNTVTGSASIGPIGATVPQAGYSISVVEPATASIPAATEGDLSIHMPEPPKHGLLDTLGTLAIPSGFLNPISVPIF
nr:putative ORF1 [Marmot picobirnavirus]